MRRAVALLLVLVLAVAAWASTLTNAKTSLTAALNSRIAAIGNPQRSAPEWKELKHLKKAVRSLSKFQATLDAPGIIALVSSGRSIVKSNTADGGVQSEVAVMVNCLVDALTVQEQELIADAEGMLAPADRIKLRGYLDTAAGLIDQAVADAPSNPQSAFNNIKLAFAQYVKAGRFVQKILKQQAHQALPIMRPDFNVQNRNRAPLKITKIEFDFFYYPPVGDPIRVQESFTDHQQAPHTLPYSVPAFVVGDTSTEFPMYPTMHRAISSVVGSNPNGTVHGVIRFVSNKHGTVLIPVMNFPVYTP